MLSDLAIYLTLLCANVALLGLLILWRGLISFEGIGSALVLLAITSDAVGLLGSLVLAPSSATTAELASRVYPTAVHAVGFLAMAAGLYVADPRPTSVVRELTNEGRARLLIAASFLVVLGIAMQTLSLYSAGMTSIGQYFGNLYQYTVNQGQLGGFVSKGTPILLLGFGFLIVAQGDRLLRQGLLLGTLVVASFSLSNSRADLIATLLMLFFVVGALKRSLLTRVVSQRWILPLVLVSVVFLVLVDAGVKSQVRYLSSRDAVQEIDLSVSSLLNWGRDRFTDRFSQRGLYDGYSNLVDRLEKGEAPMFGGRVISYTMTAWVPYLVYKNKPQHPFRDTGHLVYDDRHSSLEDVSASMLVGSAYADFGVASVGGYLFLYGWVLGVIRRVAVRRSGSILWLVWYIHFTLIDGATNMIHGGVVNLPDSLALATGSIGLLCLFLVARSLARRLSVELGRILSPASST